MPVIRVEVPEGTPQETKKRIREGVTRRVQPPSSGTAQTGLSTGFQNAASAARCNCIIYVKANSHSAGQSSRHFSTNANPQK